MGLTTINATVNTPPPSEEDQEFCYEFALNAAGGVGGDYATFGEYYDFCIAGCEDEPSEAKEEDSKKQGN